MATRLPTFDMLDPEASPDLKRATDDFRQHTAALRRQREMNAALGSHGDNPTSSAEGEAITEPGALSSETASDISVVSGKNTALHDAIEQTKDEISRLMDDLLSLEPDFAETIPGLENMDEETKKSVISNIAQQEANWTDLSPAQIVIPKAEVALWSSFVGTAKPPDFMKERSIKSLERGEILDLKIGGFQQFQIVKIRTKNKQIEPQSEQSWAMSVIELIVDTPEGRAMGKVKAHYFIALPLMEGGSLTLMNKNTMKPLNSYRIQQLSINKVHRSMIKQFLDLFA